MFEGRMKFRRANQPMFEDNCYLMCFQTRILTFEVEDDEEVPAEVEPTVSPEEVGTTVGPLQ